MFYRYCEDILKTIALDSFMVTSYLKVLANIITQNPMATAKVLHRLCEDFEKLDKLKDFQVENSISVLICVFNSSKKELERYRMKQLFTMAFQYNRVRVPQLILMCVNVKQPSISERVAYALTNQVVDCYIVNGDLEEYMPFFEKIVYDTFKSDPAKIFNNSDLIAIFRMWCKSKYILPRANEILPLLINAFNTLKTGNVSCCCF